MRIVTLLLASALLGAVPLGGAQAQKLAPPRIIVQNVHALDSSPGSQRFRVTLLLDNLNEDPLPVMNLDFKLRLADQGILDGGSAVPITIPALERQTLSLDLSSDIISSVSQLMSFTEGPDNVLPYEIYGTVTLERARREPVAFSVKGQVPFTMAARR